MKYLLRYMVLCAILFIIVANPTAAQADVLLSRINNLRASVGVGSYALNGALSAAAQNHAQWMAVTKQVSHYQFDGSTPTTRASAAGYPGAWVSENIYGGTGASIDSAWNFWINSSIHYRGLTNANYSEIGIGIASADGYNFFVLVFGNPGGSVNVPSAGGSGSGGGGGAPSFIVGQDNFGNLMHEIQDGQTIGDIALIYGYTWDDIPEMLELNEMTEGDIRLLQPGGIFLVPLHSGTYTPTAPPEGWSSPTPNYSNEDIVNTAIAYAKVKETEGFITQRASVLLTPLSTPSVEEMQTQETTSEAVTNEMLTLVQMPMIIGTSVDVPESLNAASGLDTSLIVEPPTLSPTYTPHPTLTASLDGQSIGFTQGTPVASVGGGDSANGANTDGAGVPATSAEVIIVREGPSPWLIVALVVQALIIVGASVEYIRRSRKA